LTVTILSIQIGRQFEETTCGTKYIKLLK